MPAGYKDVFCLTDAVAVFCLSTHPPAHSLPWGAHFHSFLVWYHSFFLFFDIPSLQKNL
jgi:hypothetical protein